MKSSDSSLSKIAKKISLKCDFVNMLSGDKKSLTPGRLKQVSNKHLKDLLSAALSDIENKRNDRPDLILAAWNEVVCEEWRTMTQAISFEKGVIVVKVKNAALYSLLVQQEKVKLLTSLQKRFPRVEIKNIVFRVG